MMKNEPISQISTRLWKPFGRGDLISVFLLALVLRLVLFAAANDQVGTTKIIEDCFDCRLYLNMAQSVVDGTGDFENGYFYFGPGYAYFLAANVYSFASRVVPIVLVNILISSLSCLLIYLLAIKLTRSYAVSITAATLCALSYTSISMSCLIMSDTLYFFVFLSALLLYLQALESGRMPYFIAAGAVMGLAALIRPVGQFWPIMMIIIAAVWYIGQRRIDPSRHFARGKFFFRVMVAVMIPVIFISSWMIRNHKVHGVYTLAITSALGPANLAAVTIERRGGPFSQEVMRGWVEDYLRDTGEPQITFGRQYSLYLDRARAVTDSLGWWEVGRTYFSLLWENLNSINRAHRQLLPRCSSFTIPWEHKIDDHYLNYLNFTLSMLGLVILLWQRRFRIAVIIGGLFFYYAAMIGSLRWQGPRHFLPGQIASSILVAIVLVFAGQYLYKGWRFACRRIYSNH